MIETLLTIIIFTIMLGLMTSISGYLYLQHGMISAAREGARMGALDTALGESGDTSNVENYVRTAVQNLTGQTFGDGDTIDVTIQQENPADTDPDAAQSVTVNINYTFTNPVNIAGFLNALGADGSSFAEIPVTATATMRYEG